MARTPAQRRNRDPFRRQILGTYKPPPKLRDAATLCRAVLNVPGSPLVCELDADHDGKHKSGCTSWASREVS